MIFAVGDIHGGYKALKQVIEGSGINKKTDTLICLGDVADGWSEVPECFEEIISFQNLVYIIGNHDAWMLQYLGRQTFTSGCSAWIKQGGQATIDAYSTRPELARKHLSFLRECAVNYYKDPLKRVFVHGGFNRHSFLINQTREQFTWDRDLFQQALSAKKTKMFYKEDISEVYVGHTSTTLWGFDKPVIAERVINLDQGAGWEGKLTIMNVDTKEYWQSDKVGDLYPEEKGRRA